MQAPPFSRLSALLALLTLLASAPTARAADTKPADAQQPNILWILAEDIGPDMGCYGTPAVKTPHIDRLAAEGALFTRAFTTAPVCSTSRSAMMVGMHQHTVGAHQHRTANKKPLPPGVRPYTHHLRDAGYFTCTEYGAKTDLNFKVDKVFEGKSWKGRKPGQPFVCQATIATTHRKFRRDPADPVDPGKVELPPYYPDHPLTRRDWADYLESVQLVDKQLGKIMARLDEEGIAKNTVVVFIGDHGRCHPRGKQFLYDGGIRVPLIIRWPGHVKPGPFKPGTIREDLISAIDITATLVAIGTGSVPDHMHGQNIFETLRQPRDHVIAARGKMDSTHDSMRAIRTDNYKYILNLMPERAYCQLNEYKERQYPVLALLNVMHLKGQLDPIQARFMSAKKPTEELYDLRTDPHETVNLADDPKYADVKRHLRAELNLWRKETGDQDPTEEFRNGGWSARYPTRTLAEWEALLAKWEDHLLRGGPSPGGKKPAKDKKKKET